MRSSRSGRRHDRRPPGGRAAVYRIPGRPLARTGRRRKAMFGKLIKAAVVAVVVVAIVQSLPDIKRYLEIRKM